MEKGKINLISLVIIVILVLLLGVAVGYIISTNITGVVKTQVTKGEELKEPVYENVAVEKESNKTTDTKLEDVETVKYDVEEKIFVNGEVCKVSCNNKLIENDNEMEKYETTVYFNDKEIKTLETKKYVGDNYSSVWNREDEINLSIIKDYEVGSLEYILFYVNSDTPSGNYKNIYIVNKDGKILKELNWTSAYGISIVGKNENENINLETYGLKAREIIIYKPDYSKTEKEGLLKYTYTIKNGQVQEAVQKVSEVTGVVSAGK